MSTLRTEQPHFAIRLAAAGALVLLAAAPLAAQEVQTAGNNPPMVPRRVDQVPSPSRSFTTREMAEIKADLMMIRKQYPDAVDAYIDLLRAEPRNPVLLNKIGMAYTQLSRPDQAKRYFERAIKADQSFARAHNNLGAVHYQRKNYGRAVKCYERAIALGEKGEAVGESMATYYSNLGYALFGAKKYPEALTAFQKALALDQGVLDRKSMGGTILQDRTVEERARFFFFLARAFALQNNAERVLYYLRKARDDGYKIYLEVPKDPAFAEMMKDEQIKELLIRATPEAPAKKTE